MRSPLFVTLNVHNNNVFFLYIYIFTQEHIAVHTGQDLYSCSYCPMTFKSNANMSSHRKKVHPNEWEANRLKRLTKS